MAGLTEDQACQEMQMTGTVERYVAGTLPEAELAAFEEHLVSCQRCQEEVRLASALREAFVQEAAATTTEAVPGAPEKRRWLGIGVVGSALAAAGIAALLIVGPRAGVESDRSEPTHRDSPTEAPTDGVLRMEIVRPADEALLLADSVIFEWRPASADALYSLTLTDANGDLVWRSTSRDTVVLLSGDVALASGSYFWYVDARLEDGRTASTGAHTFTIER